MRSLISQWVRGFNKDEWWKWYSRSKKTNNTLWKAFCEAKYMRIATKGGGYIGRETVFKGCPNLVHGFHGIHISRTAVIGKNVSIYQNVTIGATEEHAAVIGDNVLIGANAVIIGNVHIGNYVKIGAGAIVVDDIPDYSTVVSEKAKIIRKTDRE